jgi:hypothetical protein
MKPVAAIAVVAIVTVSGAACERAEAPAKPVPQPAALLVEVALPTLDSSLAGIKKFANAVQPGVAAFIIERNLINMAGLGSLDGAAGDQPAHLLVVDPRTHAKPLAALVRVTDGAKLKAAAEKEQLAIREKSGHAVVGDKAVVALVADWAFATLPARTAPTFPVATAHSAAVLAAYRTDIEQASSKLPPEAQTAGGPDMKKIVDLYARGAIAVLEGSERLELRVEANESDASLGFAVVAKKGSTVAGFIDAQSPSDFALLEKLPPGAAHFVLAGTILLGPARDKALALIEELFVSVYHIEVTDEIRAVLNRWADSLTGDVAASVEIGPGGLRMSQLVGARDAAELHRSLGGLLGRIGDKTVAVTTMGTTTLMSARPDAITVDGVSFHRYTSKVDTSAMTPEQTKLGTAMGREFVGLVGAWDDVLGFSIGGNAASAEVLVAAARGKAPRISLPARVTADLAAARARRDSAYYFVDVGAMMSVMAPMTGVTFPAPLGFGMTLGFRDDAAELRIAMKSAEIKAVIAAAAAMAPPK